MRERPIMFKGEMVRAILAGRKTQTRRVVKWDSPNAGGHDCPHGQPGDRLWVKETFAAGPNNAVAYRADGSCGAIGGDGDGRLVFYKHGHIQEIRPEVDGRVYGLGMYGGKWKSAMFMPRKHSRILLEITDVRVERLNDISEADALAEGIEELEQGPPMERYWAPDGDEGHHSASHAYAELWDSINRKTHPWASNPWVWALTFKRVEVARG